MKIFSVLLLIICASCGSNTEQRKDGFSQPAANPEDSLFKAVMDEHDTAMSKMKKLSTTRVRIDSLVKTKAKKERPAFETISHGLKDAQDHMNEWMEQFSIDSAQDNSQKRLEYLSGERIKASNVKNEILSVLAKADSALKK